MNEELHKIQSLLIEIKKLIHSNPGLIAERQFYESWEMAYKPRPFFVNGAEIQIGSHIIRFAPKGEHIVWIDWHEEQQRPVIIVESHKHRHLFILSVNEEDLLFSEPETVVLQPFSDSELEEIRIVYDVIEHLLTERPPAEVLKLTRKKIIHELNLLSAYYDEKQIKKISKLSASRLKNIIQQAVTTETVSEERYCNYKQTILKKTRWKIMQELELLLSMTQYNYQFQKDFVIQLADCEIIPIDDPNKTLIGIPGMKNMTLQEGIKFTVQWSREKRKLGVYMVGMCDYDTVYGDIQWGSPDGINRIHDCILVPRKMPGRIVPQRIESLYQQLSYQREAITGALSGILGLTETMIDTAIDNNAALETELNAPMDFSQKQAFSASINEKNPIVAIKGAPGSGKTWVLVRIIWHLCQQGKRILLIAPSNTVIDNICKRISDLPLLRLGNQDKVDPEVKDSCWFGNPDNIEAYLEKRKSQASGAVYATTQMRSLFDELISKELYHHGPFDLVVFDEAGMSHLDEFILCSKMGKRVVLFGDRQMLPSFSLSDEVLNLLKSQHRYLNHSVREIIECSPIEWLEQNRKLPVIRLQKAYRCQNPRLMRFFSILFSHSPYKNTTLKKLPDYSLKTQYPRSTLRFYRTSFMPESVRHEQIAIDNQTPIITNTCEAAICRQVFLESLETNNLSEITIITTYKAQVKLIKQLLSHETIQQQLPPSILPEAYESFLQNQITTIDGFQGGENDLIIISYVRSNEKRGIGFINNLNRIKSAHTRSKQSMILIGDLEFLKDKAQTDIFVNMEKAILRYGEIIDPDISAIKL